MDEICKWLGEQLDEDERVARAASGGTVVGEPGNWRPAPGAGSSMPALRHAARHDPARVLREVEANRRRLERHTPQMMVGYDSDENDPATYVPGCPTCQTTVVNEGDWPCEEIRDALVSYADRPGYREDWAPQS